MVKGSVQEKGGYLHTVISYTDKSGKRKQKWQSTGLAIKGNKRKAQELLKERIDELEMTLEREETQIPDMPFSQFMSNWLAMIKPTVLITTYGSYQYFIEKRINPYFDEKNITLQKIKTVDIQEYYNTMLSKGTKWNSVAKHHAVIRKALDYAVKMDYILVNPAVKIETPKRQKFIAEHYNREELQELFEAVKGDLLEVPVILSAFYGLRRSEALGLKWSAIDFEQKTLCIKHTVCRISVDGKDVIVRKDTTKNKTSLRTLPLIPDVEKLLLKAKKQQESNRRKCRNAYNKEFLDYVCVDDIGNLLRPDYLSQHLQTVLKRNNLKHIRYHDLRHSCASLLLANGVSLKEIQDWLGHSDFSTTANIYSHLEYGAKVKSANKIAENLSLEEKTKDG